MELGQTEVIPVSPVAEHVSSSMWQKVAAAVGDIPVSEKTAEHVIAVSQKLDAPALQGVRRVLEQHAHTIGIVAKVGATAVDMTTAAICGAATFGQLKLLGGRPEQQAYAATKEKFGSLLERTADLNVAKVQKTAAGLGLLGGSILLVRPVSRLVVLGSSVTRPMSERVAQVINAMAGGSQQPVA